MAFLTTARGDSWIRDMELEMLKIPMESEPGEAYYRMVLRVKDAVDNKLLVPVPNSWGQGTKGANTELYSVGTTFYQMRLPSHREVRSARYFFDQKEKQELNQRSISESISSKNLLISKKEHSTITSLRENMSHQSSFRQPVSRQSSPRHTTLTTTQREKLTDEKKEAMLERLLLRQEKEMKRKTMESHKSDTSHHVYRMQKEPSQSETYLLDPRALSRPGYQLKHTDNNARDLEMEAIREQGKMLSHFNSLQGKVQSPSQNGMVPRHNTDLIRTDAQLSASHEDFHGFSNIRDIRPDPHSQLDDGSISRPFTTHEPTSVLEPIYGKLVPQSSLQLRENGQTLQPHHPKVVGRLVHGSNSFDDSSDQRFYHESYSRGGQPFTVVVPSQVGFTSTPRHTILGRIFSIRRGGLRSRILYWLRSRRYRQKIML